jgi:RimJ/RimL family protein N-acetyltransferase
MSNEDVRRFIPQPPATPADFVRFIQWTRSQHETGTVLSLGMVPEGDEAAVGMLQLHELEPPFRTAEWGFVLGRPYWGSGLFKAGAALFLQFVFETVGVHRLEARAMTANVRANEVLRHSGWTEEGHLRRSFLLGGTYHDDVLWALLRDDWMRQQAASR